MKHLKSYKIFESKRYPDEVIQTIKDIFIELEDEHFSIEINEPKLNNMMRLNISIISGRGDLDAPFTRILYFRGAAHSCHFYSLGDIKDEVQRMVDYLQELNEGYFLEEVDGYGPTFNNFNKIELPTDVNQWEDDQQLVMLNLYIDHDETLKII